MRNFKEQLLNVITDLLVQDVPETFNKMKLVRFVAKKELRKRHITLLQRKGWKDAKRAVVYNREGVIVADFGAVIPLENGQYAAYQK